MTTELLLKRGTARWDEIADTVGAALADLLDGMISAVSATIPASGQRVDAHRVGNGGLRLSAAGNDSLSAGHRLTVRDERAVIAVGFSVASAGWGTFYWDWSSPVAAESVASGVVRTMRDIYKVDPGDVEVSVTL